MNSNPFPNLRPDNHTVASPATADYNCIAWAVGCDDSWWWPDPFHQYYWPAEIPINDSLSAFESLFRTFGYEITEESEYEPGFEKIAIYVGANGRVTHASRQLDSGAWTSKLGALHDIEHTLDGVSDGAYGSIATIMKRPK